MIANFYLDHYIIREKCNNMCINDNNTYNKTILNGDETMTTWLKCLTIIIPLKILNQKYITNIVILIKRFN